MICFCGSSNLWKSASVYGIGEDVLHTYFYCNDCGLEGKDYGTYWMDLRANRLSFWKRIKNNFKKLNALINLNMRIKPSKQRRHEQNNGNDDNDNRDHLL